MPLVSIALPLSGSMVWLHYGYIAVIGELGPIL